MLVVRKNVKKKVTYIYIFTELNFVVGFFLVKRNKSLVQVSCSIQMKAEFSMCLTELSLGGRELREKISKS